ncbi:CBS domain-containing protein [Candidatus Bathyarchaeota archaeon]|nr:CBS domain-containing protein [Candidatus Bathyarchaeota archaeon]MBS7613531.1 CBS domain-containing protein [Candidatus Bathyarchaeota archaeon]MBS7617188.1 CBS domain-containing protein [Candidatus Bathyarchaeota archaeon]
MSYGIPSGEAIRRLRRTVGLTQKELAKRAGLSQSLISRIERGDVDPRLSTVKRIMHVIEESTVKEWQVASYIMHRPVICVNAKQPVEVAVKLMKKNDISQLPVVDDNNTPIGAIQESTIIHHMVRERDFKRLFKMTIRDIMEGPFPEIAPNTPVHEILQIFLKGAPAVLVIENSKILGIIAKIDLITTFLNVEAGKVLEQNLS